MAYVGVINPLNPRVESAEEVRDALVRAANFIPKEQLGATDDCGFSVSLREPTRVTRLRQGNGLAGSGTGSRAPG